MPQMLTLPDFLDYLEEDLAWRKQEITSLLLLDSNQSNLVVAKASVLLIYSHWEGYIKNICKKYLLHLSGLQLPINDLTTNLQGVALKSVAGRTLESNNSLTLTNEIELLQKIYSEISDVFTIPEKILREKNKDFINTKDNLNLSVLNSFCKIVGIGQVTMVLGREKYLDQGLLHQRNAISHGSKVDIRSREFNLGIDDIKKLRDFVFFLMEYVKEELAYYSSNQLYLKENEEVAIERQNSKSQDVYTRMESLLQE